MEVMAVKANPDSRVEAVFAHAKSTPHCLPSPRDDTSTETVIQNLQHAAKLIQRVEGEV